MTALTWWLVGVGTAEHEPSPTSVAHLPPQHIQELQGPRGTSLSFETCGAWGALHAWGTHSS